MAVTVTYHAPSTVKTTHVTFWMETVLGVNLDGEDCLVTQVWLIVYIYIFVKGKGVLV